MNEKKPIDAKKGNKHPGVKIPKSTKKTLSEKINSGEVRSRRMLDLLSKASTAMMQARTEEELLNRICSLAIKPGGYRMAWVGYADQDAQKSVCPVAQQGFDKGYLDKVKIVWADAPQGRGPTGTAIRTGKPCLARNIPNDPIFKPWRKAVIQYGYRSSIALPLKEQKRVFGALNVYAEEADAFDDNEVRILTDLADNLAFGIFALRSRAKQKQMQEQVKRSEEKWRKLFEILPVGASIVSADHQVLDFNPMLSKILDISRERMQKVHYQKRLYYRNDDTPHAGGRISQLRAIREKTRIKRW